MVWSRLVDLCSVDFGSNSAILCGYKLENPEVGLDPNDQAVICYIDVTDIKSSLQTLIDAGAVIQQDIRDVGGGLLIAQIKDANGNVLGLRSPK